MKRGTNPKSLAALQAHAIKPGEVRNPEGINRRRRPFSDLYDLLGEEVLSETERRKLNQEVGFALHRKGETRIEASIRGLYYRAESGDPEAIRELANRLEGRPPQRLEIAARPAKTEVIMVIKYEDSGGKRYGSQEWTQKQLESPHRSPVTQ